MPLQPKYPSFSTLFREIKTLFIKDFILDLHHLFSFWGCLLYVGCIIFIHYLGIELAELSHNTAHWNIQFWLCIVLMALFLVPKYFSLDKPKLFYLYTLTPPEVYFFSRTFYLSTILSIIAICCYLIFILLFFNPLSGKFFGIFLLLVLLGNNFFSTCFCLICFMAFRSGYGYFLFSILAIPLSLPIIALLFKTSLYLIHGILHTTLFCILVSCNVIFYCIAFILFPYLWKT